MKETIRCCISCILPCGALDVIRIVHANGRVEEISRAVRAADILQDYPKHVLRKPPSSSSSTFSDYDDHDVSHHRKAIIVPPNAELQRGKIYFLMPVATSPAVPEKQRVNGRRRRKKRDVDSHDHGVMNDRTRLLVSDDQYLSEILSEKVMSSQRDRRRGRVAVWRPHLESISEASNDL
ncbi:hypothetical protein DsansV1_C23g0179861 [Dioscorea sansibarensis]